MHWSCLLPGRPAMLCAAGPLWITASSPWVARLRRRGGSRPWLLFEWDDHNNIHALPPGTDPGGRVGVGNMLARRASPCAGRCLAFFTKYQKPPQPAPAPPPCSLTLRGTKERGAAGAAAWTVSKGVHRSPRPGRGLGLRRTRSFRRKGSGARYVSIDL